MTSNSEKKEQNRIPEDDVLFTQLHKWLHPEISVLIYVGNRPLPICGSRWHPEVCYTTPV